jgi:molybdopterin molybdotransferase
MIDYKTALRLVLKEAKACQSQKIKLKDSFKRVCASNIYSSIDLPPFDRVTMDGFALRSRDLKLSLGDFEIIDVINAGKLSKKIIQKNQAIKVTTGCVLPKCADKVVKVEDTVLVKKYKVRILKNSFEKNVAYRGQDCQKRDLLLKKNQINRIPELSLLASTGINNLKVFKKPKVAIIATGNEIIEPTSKLKPGFLRNSTSLMLKVLLNNLGVEDKYLGIVKDNKKILKDKIRQGLNADILIITGGVSMGERDYVPEILHDLKVKKIFHKVSIKPGKPLWCGKKDNTLVFGLPGNPVSSLVSFKLFIKPLILKMQGQNYKLNIFQGLLKRDFKVNQDRLSFNPCKANYINGQFKLSPVIFNSSGDMKAISESEGFFLARPGSYVFKKNSKIDFIRL